MKNIDKFLLGIIAGIILLVGVAFVVALGRPKPTYQPEATPEGVAHNYLFAIQQEDYTRAYNYLSPSLEGYPTSADKFSEDLNDYAWQVRELKNQSVTLAVDSTRFVDDRATVTIRETHFYRGDLFNSNQYTTTFDMTLKQENGEWKIIRSNSYWASCWDDSRGCL
jgi:hypothetical protein